MNKMLNTYFKKIGTFFELIKADPRALLLKKPFRFWVPDGIYLKTMFRQKVGHELDLNNPKTYNEKIQWLKLNYRDPLLNTLVDKYAVKQYVADKIGDEHVINCYGVWNSFEDIDFDKLPTQFVLKTTHDFGGTVICKDKSKFDKEKAEFKINEHLKKNHFYSSREWAYKNIKPRILAEKYFVEKNNTELKDYKFYCFHGEPKLLLIITNRFSGNRKSSFFNINLERLDVSKYENPLQKPFKKPKNYDMMVKLARQLSEGLPHVRIDFYNVNGKILFGEYTFYPASGMIPFEPRNWGSKIGDWLDLSRDMEYKKQAPKISSYSNCFKIFGMK